MDKVCCHNCRFCVAVPQVYVTICRAVEGEDKKEIVESAKELLYTDKCPLREEREEDTFIYWR